MNRDLSDNEIKGLIGFCSFETMGDFVDFQINMELGMYDNSMKFFRKSNIGKWYSYFSDNLSRKMDEAVTANLRYSQKIDYGTEPNPSSCQN